MEDIVERLRFAADDTDAVENASVAYLLEEAASELARLRITDAERKALEWAEAHAQSLSASQTAYKHADTLRGLLERMTL